MKAGIPVINLDRDLRHARRPTGCWIGGDNYGMGVNAGNYIGKQAQGQAERGHRELAGIDNLALTQAAHARASTTR